MSETGKITLEKQAEKEMNTHAETYYPNECCGFMFGSDTDENRNITEVKPVANVKEGDQRKRFRIDPGDYQKAERYALDNNLDLLGVYHSHPDHPAEPSDYDLKRALPFFSYVIISVKEGKAETLRSWRLTDNGKFKEEEISTNLKTKT